MRRVATPIFVTLGVLLLLISLLTGYATALIISDSGFADHGVAAIQQPGVQSALSKVVTNKIMAKLPAQYQVASPFVERASAAVIASEQFQRAFHAVLLHTHHALLSEHNNKVVLNLAREGAVISTYLTTLDPRLAQRLKPATQSLSKIGGTNGLLPVIRALDKIHKVSIFAPIIALLFLVLALFVSTNRRHTMRTIGISVAALGGVVWVLISLAGWLLPMFINDPLKEAMPGLWTVFTNDLKRDSLVLAVLGLILVAVASVSLPLPSSTPSWAGVRAWFERSWAHGPSRVAIAGVAIVVGVVLILSPLNLFRAVIFALGAAAVYFGTSAVMQLGSHREVAIVDQPSSTSKTLRAPPMDATRWSVAVGVGIVFLIVTLRATLTG